MFTLASAVPKVVRPSIEFIHHHMTLILQNFRCILSSSKSVKFMRFQDTEVQCHSFFGACRAVRMIMHNDYDVNFLEELVRSEERIGDTLQKVTTTNFGSLPLRQGSLPSVV